MVARLRKLSATKPMSFNEYGTVGVRVSNTTDVQSKNEYGYDKFVIIGGTHGG